MAKQRSGTPWGSTGVRAVVKLYLTIKSNMGHRACIGFSDGLCRRLCGKGGSGRWDIAEAGALFIVVDVRYENIPGIVYFTYDAARFWPCDGHPALYLPLGIMRCRRNPCSHNVEARVPQCR